MKTVLLCRSAVAALLFMAFAINAKAQKIEEQDLKINVDKIADPIQQLKTLDAVTFQYNTQKYKHLQLPAGEQRGFLATSVKQEHPDLVQETSKIYTAGKNATKTAKYDTVDNNSLIPILVAAINAQQEQIDLLKKELSQLREKSK